MNSIKTIHTNVQSFIRSKYVLPLTSRSITNQNKQVSNLKKTPISNKKEKSYYGRPRIMLWHVTVLGQINFRLIFVRSTIDCSFKVFTFQRSNKGRDKYQLQNSIFSAEKERKKEVAHTKLSIPLPRPSASPERRSSEHTVNSLSYWTPAVTGSTCNIIKNQQVKPVLTNSIKFP